MKSPDNELRIGAGTQPTTLAAELAQLSQIELLKDEMKKDTHGLEDLMPDSKLLHQIDEIIHREAPKNPGED